MPSAKILSEKQAYVADLKAKFESAVSGCVVAYGGINVENDTKLRKELREAGVDYMVVKNTMLRLAVKGTSLESLAESFKGDTAIAISKEDPIAAARILNKFAEADKSKSFTIKGGYMDGKVMELSEVQALANIPALPILQAQVLGTMLAPITGLAVVLKQIAEKDGEVAAPAEEAAPEAAPAE